MIDAMHPIDRSAHALLVVNDDPASRYATVRLLQNAGFRTREVATGTAALQAADETVSAIVLDVHLPDIDGWEVVRQLRARPDTARTPILHLTAAFTSDQDKVRGLDAGGDAYLTHPVEPAVLVATVQALVRTRVAELAMRLSERKFRAIYAQAPGGICVLSSDGRVLDANPVMLHFLGRAREDVLGLDIASLVAEDAAARMREWLGNAAAGMSEEFSVRSPSGRVTDLAWVLSRDIEPGVHMTVATDISQRNLVELQRKQLLDSERVARSTAERTNRMKDELIAVLSHELRTPLNAIMGWTHVLLKRGGDDTTLRGLDAIDRNVRIQARLISDILDMSRLNMGKMPLMFEAVDPASVVAEALSAMQGSARDAQVSIVVDAQSSHRRVQADSSRLQQVVWNLVSNAIKFSPQGSEIQVRLRDEADGLHLTVADQGQGITPEFLPYLFDRFTQSNVKSNRQRGGLGLGLSIVKQLVQAHGGTIEAHSQGVGQGAQFKIVLPFNDGKESPVLSAPAVDDKQGADDTEGLLAGLAVLVVDDDRDACAMLSIILTDGGADVLTATNYDDALKHIANRKFDVLISDIGMPDRDGYELIREVRTREGRTSKRLPAIALTSFTRDHDREQIIQAGFDLHCAKPLRPLEIVQSVALLSGRSPFNPTR